MSWLSKITVGLGIGQCDTYRSVIIELGSYSKSSLVTFHKPVDSLTEDQVRDILEACLQAKRMRAVARNLDK